MPAPFPTPDFNNFQDLFTYSNTVTGNIFGFFTLISLFYVIFVSQKQYPTERAFASTSFIITPITLLFGVLGFIPIIFVTIPAVMSIASIFILITQRGEGE